MHKMFWENVFTLELAKSNENKVKRTNFKSNFNLMAQKGKEEIYIKTRDSLLDLNKEKNGKWLSGDNENKYNNSENANGAITNLFRI